ncbi:hypothetical protein GCM10027614_84860 [Micromonospora vulcania]
MINNPMMQHIKNIKRILKLKKTTMGIIASTISIIGIGCFLTVNTHAKKTKPEKKEVPTYAIHSDYTLDIDNPTKLLAMWIYVCRESNARNWNRLQK